MPVLGVVPLALFFDRGYLLDIQWISVFSNAGQANLTILRRHPCEVGHIGVVFNQKIDEVPHLLRPPARELPVDLGMAINESRFLLTRELMLIVEQDLVVMVFDRLVSDTAQLSESWLPEEYHKDRLIAEPALILGVCVNTPLSRLLNYFF